MDGNEFGSPDQVEPCGSWFYPKDAVKPSEGPEQGRNIIWLMLQENLSGCCMGNRLKETKIKAESPVESQTPMQARDNRHFH